MTKLQFFVRIWVIIGSSVSTCTGETDIRDNTFVFNIPNFDLVSNGEIHGWPRVFISTHSLLPVSYSLSIPGVGYQLENNVTRHNPADIRLSLDEVSTDIRLYRRDQKQNKTLILKASSEVSVFAIENDNSQSDGFIVFPTSQLGTHYYIASYKPYNAYQYPSFFCISSPYHNTSVNFTTPDGQVHQVTLKEFESFRFDGSYYSSDKKDLSGTRVQSDKPIAVTSGVFTSVREDEHSADGLLEQLPHVHSWGYNFILTPFLSSSGYVYRVYTALHSATLQISDGNVTYITAESFYEGDVTGDTVVSLTSDQPIMVVQYRKSPRPSMLIIPPTTHFTSNFTFLSISYGYINVITECAFDDGIILDESPLMDSNLLTTSDNSMCCLRKSVSTGDHTVSHIRPMQTFSVIVYGGYTYLAHTFGSAESPATNPTTTVMTEQLIPTNSNESPATNPTTTVMTEQFVPTNANEGCLPIVGITSNEGSVAPAEDFYAYGDVITVYCREGLRLIGDERLVCLNTGSWLGEIPRCSIEGNSLASSTIIAVAVGVAVGIIVTIAVAAIVVYCKRKTKPEQPASYNSTHLPTNVQDSHGQRTDGGYELPLENLDNRGYESLGHDRSREMSNYQGLYADISN